MELINSIPEYKLNRNYIPGYAGCCPQYKYRIGNNTIETATTHKALLTPHEEKLEMLDRNADDLFMEYRPAIRDIDIVNERQGNKIYKHPMVSSYEGFIPREHGEFGHRFTVQATEALSDFERLQIRDQDAIDEIKKIGLLKDKKLKSKTLVDAKSSDLKLPQILEILPEYGDLLTNIPVEKSLIKIPLIPLISPRFTAGQFEGLSIWEHPLELYLKDIGFMPHYGGHIPGAIFRYGKTFENDSKDAKRWLRGDYRN